MKQYFGRTTVIISYTFSIFFRITKIVLSSYKSVFFRYPLTSLTSLLSLSLSLSLSYSHFIPVSVVFVLRYNIQYGRIVSCCSMGCGCYSFDRAKLWCSSLALLVAFFILWGAGGGEKEPKANSKGRRALSFSSAQTVYKN